MKHKKKSPAVKIKSQTFHFDDNGPCHVILIQLVAIKEGGKNPVTIIFGLKSHIHILKNLFELKSDMFYPFLHSTP